MREVGRRWHPLWDINVAARTKDWFAAIAASHSLALRDWSRPEAAGQLASANDRTRLEADVYQSPLAMWAYIFGTQMA